MKIKKKKHYYLFSPTRKSDFISIKTYLKDCKCDGSESKKIIFINRDITFSGDDISKEWIKKNI